MRTLGRKITVFFIGILAALILLEAGLRVLGGVYGAGTLPSAGTGPGGAYVILCLGDSFTAGMGAPEGEGYPGQLERLLNEKAGDGLFTVVNKGERCQNTAQLLNSLRGYLDETKPDLVIVMSGMANSWNRWGYGSFDGKATFFSGLNDALYRVRVYRLIRLLADNIKFKLRASRSGKGAAYFAEEYKSAEEADRDAIAGLKRMSSENPGETKYYLEIGYYYLARFRYEEALGWFSRGLKAAPGDSRLICGVGRVYCQRGLFGKSLQEHEKGIRIDPGYGGNYGGIAEVYMSQGKYAMAAEWYEKQVDADPRGELPPRSLIDEMYGAVGDDPAAVQRLNELVDKIMAAARMQALEGREEEAYAARCDLSGEGSKRARLQEWVLSDLGKIAAACQGQGRIMMLMTYPSVDIEAVRDAARAYSVPLVDNYAVFEDMWASGKSKSDYFEDAKGFLHCNAEGYRVIADNIYAEMERENMLPAGTEK